MHTKHTRISDGFFHVDLKKKRKVRRFRTRKRTHGFYGVQQPFIFRWVHEKLESWKPESLQHTPLKTRKCHLLKRNILKRKVYIYVVATQIIWMFIPNLGEDEPILTNINFNWVGSTANIRWDPLELMCLSTCELKCADGSRSQLLIMRINSSHLKK